MQVVCVILHRRGRKSGRFCLPCAVGSVEKRRPREPEGAHRDPTGLDPAAMQDSMNSPTEGSPQITGFSDAAFFLPHQSNERNRIMKKTRITTKQEGGETG